MKPRAYLNNAEMLAKRLGKTFHFSLLRLLLSRLMHEYPSMDAIVLEEWMVDVANQRGYRIIVRSLDNWKAFKAPTENVLPNEELVIGMSLLQCLDFPQMLRLPAQIITRGCIDLRRLLFLSCRERTNPILAELARQALRVEPQHVIWQKIADALVKERPLSKPLLHWTRLAEPIMSSSHVNAIGWRLVT